MISRRSIAYRDRISIENVLYVYSILKIETRIVLLFPRLFRDSSNLLYHVHRYVIVIRKMR